MSKLNPTIEQLKLPYAEFNVIIPCSRMQYSRLRAKAGLNKSYNATKTVLKPQEAQVKQPKPLIEPQEAREAREAKVKASKTPVEQPKAAKAAVEAPASSGEEIDIDSILGMDESECQTAQVRMDESECQTDQLRKNEKNGENVTNECNIEDVTSEEKENVTLGSDKPISTLKPVPENDVTLASNVTNVTSPKPLTRVQLKWQQLMVQEVLQTGGIVTATRAVGMDYDIFRRWTEESSPDYSREFTEPIKNAHELFKKGDKEACLQAIEKHRERYWQAAAWLLERQYPAEFSKREGVSISSLGINLGLAITTKPGLATVGVAQAKFEVLPDQDPTADSN